MSVATDTISVMAPPKRIDDAEVIRLYLEDETRTQGWVGQRLGITAGSVGRILKTYEVPVRQMRRQPEPKRPCACGNPTLSKGGARVARCGPCQAVYMREYHLKRKYGMSPADYAVMLERQGGKCALCDKKPSARLHVDHCHETGRIRGLLCNGCNLMLGRLGDTADGVRRFIAYLEGSLDVSDRE